MSVPTNARTIGRHFLPAMDDELKNLPSVNASETGLRQALSAMFNLLISSRSTMTAASKSSVLFRLSRILCKVKGLIGGEPCLPLQIRRYDIVHHVDTRYQDLVVIHEEPSHVRNNLLGDVLGYLLRIFQCSFQLGGARGR